MAGETEANHMAALAAPLAARVQTRLVDGTPSRAEVRFFHSGDEARAQQVAQALRSLEPRLEIRDFGAFRPSPSPGTIEVWVPVR